jgi:hypothetical protein
MVGTAHEMPKKVSEMVLIYRFFFPNCQIKGLDEKWLL